MYIIISITIEIKLKTHLQMLNILSNFISLLLVDRVISVQEIHVAAWSDLKLLTGFMYLQEALVKFTSIG